MKLALVSSIWVFVLFFLSVKSINEEKIISYLIATIMTFLLFLVTICIFNGKIYSIPYCILCIALLLLTMMGTNFKL